MVRITRFLYIHILLAPMIIISYYVGSLFTFFVSFGVVMIHEVFHLIAALVLGVGVRSIIILPFGMTLRLSGDVIRHPKKEIVIALSGPAANVLMLFFAQFMTNGMNLTVFKVINWSVLILNLIPVPPLDGGRVLRAFIIKYAGVMRAVGIVRKISKVLIFVIIALGVVIAILTRGNPSLMVIGAFLTFSLTDERKNSDILIMHSLIDEKEKFRNKKLIPTDSLCVRYDAPAKSVIRKLNFSTFYIVYIIDENQKIIKTATESDFIRAVRKKGYMITSENV